MSPSKVQPHFRVRYLLLPASLAIALYVVLPQIGGFSSSWHKLGSADLGWLLLAVVLTASTYFAAAATYCFLSSRHLRYLVTVLVQVAAMFFNRLLPGGVGALGANFLYLRNQHHNTAEASSLVAINNILGLIGHSLLLAITALLYGGSLPRLAHRHSLGPWYLWAGLGVAVVLLAILSRRRLKKFINDLGAQLVSVSRRPGRLLAALASSICLTTANTLALYACTMSLGIQLPFVAVLVVLSLGVGAGTATPTPGGLGAFEAGIVGGLVFYGIGSSQALAVALLYRLISFWLALAAGAVALLLVERRGLLGA